MRTILALLVNVGKDVTALKSLCITHRNESRHDISSDEVVFFLNQATDRS